MTLIRLGQRSVERIWGRQRLPRPFAAGAIEEPVGEMWFEDPALDDAELLVKYLFTSQRLSIQVHPDDHDARLRGYRRGKDEAWLVLDAEPGAVIGIGLVETVSREELRAAAIDGRIEKLVDWRPVASGDFFYSPGGTIHAIGAGLSLIEIQQNLDLTYRLYDYGRPRELHLDDGIAVANPAPFASVFVPRHHQGRTILAAGGAFVVERWHAGTKARLAADPERAVTVIAAGAGGSIKGEPLPPGSVWHLDEPADLASAGEGDLILAYPGAKPLSA